MTFRKALVWLWRHLLRVPARWLPDHAESRDRKEPLKFKELEPVKRESVGQLLQRGLVMMHGWSNVHETALAAAFER